MSIATKVHECLHAFKALRQHLKSLAAPNTIIACEDFEDELGRFRVWAGNIGAHRVGQRSLDHRLRDATELKEAVEAYLTDLAMVLDRGKSQPVRMLPYFY